MVELSAGKKLCEARLARHLSIDAAAHATKMRPDKILALENDDFTRFGGAAYAKSFLVLYSRYLGVEVSEQLRELDLGDRRVNIRDYQYLSNAPAPKPVERLPIYHRRPARPPSILPILGFMFALFVAGAYFYVRDYARRLGLDKPTDTPSVEVVETHAPPAAAAAPTTAPEVADAAPDPAPPANPPDEQSPASEPPTATPAPATAAVSAAADADNAMNELSVEPLRKTYVTIWKSRNSPPVFEGDIYPNGQTLKVHGPSFFIEVRDQAAVQIRKNGQPIAYQAPGMLVD